MFNILFFSFAHKHKRNMHVCMPESRRATKVWANGSIDGCHMMKIGQGWKCCDLVEFALGWKKTIWIQLVPVCITPELSSKTYVGMFTCTQLPNVTDSFEKLLSFGREAMFVFWSVLPYLRKAFLKQMPHTRSLVQQLGRHHTRTQAASKCFGPNRGWQVCGPWGFVVMKTHHPASHCWTSAADAQIMRLSQGRSCGLAVVSLTPRLDDGIGHRDPWSIQCS